MSASNTEWIGTDTRNYIYDKTTINNLWSTMVAGARSDVYILAGDVSWIDRDEVAIKQQIQHGKKISVICRRPLHKEIQATKRLREHMKRLLLAGADVRYYSEELSQEPKIRGVFIDRFIHSAGLLVRKSPKFELSNLADSKLQNWLTHSTDRFVTGVDRAEGIPGSERNYTYSGLYYTPPKDTDDILVLCELFDRIWHDALTAFVLEKLDLSLTDYCRILRGVPQYATITEEHITLERIHTHELWAGCQVVKSYKFEPTAAIIDAYQTQKLDFFEPCVAISSGNPKHSILLPPIVERHGEKMVIIDGMHRLYWSRYHAKLSQVTCLVVSPTLALPGEPIPLDKVVVRSDKANDRRQIFIDFQPHLFRQISLLDRNLCEALQVIDSQIVVTLPTDPSKLGNVAPKDENTFNTTKILFLGVSPKDAPRLRLDEEIRSIKQALRQTKFRNQFVVEQEWAVRVDDLQRHLLQYEPDIVHLSTHSNEANAIILEDNTGKMRPVPEQALGQLFSTLKDNIKCVVLNICYSEAQAKAIAEHIDYVIGMSDAIADEAAIGFSTSFYQALGYGRSIKIAFDLGVGQLDLENLGEKDRPRLFIRSHRNAEDLDLE